MQTRITILSVIFNILLGSTIHADVDYSKCARFFNNLPSQDGNLKGYRIRESGPFVPRRYRYIPFEIKSDGELTVYKHDGIHYERKKTGKIKKEVITYSSPSLESLETLDLSQLTGNVETKVIVERNSDGHITAITEGVGLVTDEEAEMRRIEQWNGGDADLAFAYRGTKTTFGMAAGQCVPLDSRELVTQKRGGERRETEIRVFDTKLCRKLHEALGENHEMRAAFEGELNSNVTRIFVNHAREFVIPENEDNEFLSNSKVQQLVNILSDEYATAPELSLKLQVYTAFRSDTIVERDRGKIFGKALRLERKRYGVSPVISANMVVANCYYHYLHEFFWSPDFWNE